MAAYPRKHILSQGPQKGFTLIEILATFVLIAVIIPVAMKGLSLSTNMAGNSKRKIEASSLAETKLTELMITGDWINGEQSGNFGEDWPEYTWRAELEDWEDEDLMQQLTLWVSWYGTGQERSVFLTTLIYSGDS
jgi:prepilin-type N-terminal cleavage/methylation domain-containing protein